MIGKQLAILGDMRIGSKTNQAAIAENLLRVSGGDMVTIHRKYKPAWNGPLPTRFLILSNELPHLADASTALANRYLPLVFFKSYLGREDPDLLVQLLAELPGILNWSIEGWRRLKERGRFELPPESKEVLGSLIDLGSPVTAFVEEQCELHPEASVNKNELFQSWRAYCDQRGFHPGTISTFAKDLMAAVPSVGRSKERRSGSQRVMSFLAFACGAQRGRTRRSRTGRSLVACRRTVRLESRAVWMIGAGGLPSSRSRLPRRGPVARRRARFF